MIHTCSTGSYSLQIFCCGPSWCSYLFDCFCLCSWTAVATWRWIANDDNCGICRTAFDGCCPDCKMPGDDCPLGKSSHWFTSVVGVEAYWDEAGKVIIKKMEEEEERKRERERKGGGGGDKKKEVVEENGFPFNKSLTPINTRGSPFCFWLSCFWLSCFKLSHFTSKFK